MLAIANCQHSYSYVLPYLNVFLDVTNYDISNSVYCANLTVENSIDEQQTLTIVGYEASKGWTVIETSSNDWAMSRTIFFAKVTWAWLTAVETTLHVLLVATHIMTTNSLSCGSASATH